MPEKHNVESVPVIDIAPAAAGGEAAVQIAKEIGSACQQIGFLVITGHGVDGGCLEEMHKVCKAYFELPEQTKRLACADPPDRFRGYTGPGDRGGAAGSPPDLLETFEACSFETPQDMAAAGYSATWWSQQLLNLWAPQPPEMKEVWHRYMGEMDRLANKLMRLAALSLDLPEDWFEDKYDRSCSYQVANYYPPQFEPPVPGQLRQSAHTDFGAFTILYQDSDVGGLQVRTRSGGWTGVPALKGAFVINLGDLLAKWTNDRWVATEHRVVNPPLGSGTARISIPFFHHPNKDAVIEPIPTCVDAQHPARYPAVEAGRWTEFRMANYTLPQAG